MLSDKDVIHKMVKQFIFLTAVLFFGISQSLNAQIIEKSIKKIKTSKRINYTSIFNYKDPFVDSFTTDTIYASIGIKTKYREAGGYFNLRTSAQRAIYGGDSLLQLSLPDSSYSLTKEISNNLLYKNSLLYYVNYLDKIVKTPFKVIRLGDTIINNKLFYHLRISELDSIANGEHIFVFTELVIDKKNYLPHFMKTENQGFFGNTLIKMVSENTFYNYQTNLKFNPDLFTTKIPDNFKLDTPKKSEPPLGKGVKAPDIELYDSFGNVLKPEALKGKIVLLNFTTNGCPHSIEAIPSLNKIHKKYQGPDFLLITINTVDDRDAVLKFNKKFNVHYKTYINGKAIADTYHIDSYPTFYIVDKTGIISEQFSGYYQELEKQLIEKIELLKQ